MSNGQSPTRCTRCQNTLTGTVIIVAQPVPRDRKRPRERDSTFLLHVCQQCATQSEMNRSARVAHEHCSSPRIIGRRGEVASCGDEDRRCLGIALPGEILPHGGL